MSRLSESFISSEDLKHECNADKLYCDRQIGMSCQIEKEGKWIGYIQDCSIYLGDDILIKKIIIYDNEELSKKLTEKYQSKILICSHFKDDFIS